MKKKLTALTRQDFARFLAWLNPDREQAAELYNSLHRRLTMYFAGRGCGAAAAELASLTLDRTAAKFASVEAVEGREPARYIFQVANFILLEHLRAPKASQLNPDIAVVDQSHESSRLRCCRECLSQLPEEERHTIQDYYLGEKKGEAKRIRGQLAVDLGIAQGALRIRLFRIKQKLYKCMTRCLESNLMGIT